MKVECPTIARAFDVCIVHEHDPDVHCVEGVPPKDGQSSGIGMEIIEVATEGGASTELNTSLGKLRGGGYTKTHFEL